jgi:hypothetical protein
MVANSAVWDRVEAPAVTPHPFGLFSVATPESPADSGWQLGVQWQSMACYDPFPTYDECINGGVAESGKTIAGCADYPLATFKPITVYAGVNRSGASQDVAQADAQAVLTAGEEWAVEKALWAALLAASPPVAAPAGTKYQFPLMAGLANVEGWLSTNYHGTGVIHMNRGTAAGLGNLLVRQGQQLQTITGTPVAAGGGYDSTFADSAAGSPVMYATGAVAIRRSTISNLTAVDRQVNDVLSLAERTYVVGWDCAVIGRTVT